jgi:hypothetical protein
MAGVQTCGRSLFVKLSVKFPGDISAECNENTQDQQVSYNGIRLINKLYCMKTDI